MKHTICTADLRITIQPDADGLVAMRIEGPRWLLPQAYFTPEQAGLLSQAFELAVIELDHAAGLGSAVDASRRQILTGPTFGAIESSAPERAAVAGIAP